MRLLDVFFFHKTFFIGAFMIFLPNSSVTETGERERKTERDREDKNPKSRGAEENPKSKEKKAKGYPHVWRVIIFLMTVSSEEMLLEDL